MKGIKSLGTVALALLLVGSQAQENLFFDGFETGNHNAWFLGTSGASIPTIVTDPVRYGTKASFYNNSVGSTYGRYWAALSRSTTPSDQTVVSFWMWDPTPNPPSTFPIGRQYVELRDYVTPTTQAGSTGTIGVTLRQLLGSGINSNDGIPAIPPNTAPGTIINGSWGGLGQSTARFRGRLLTVSAGSGVPGWDMPNNSAPNWISFGQTGTGAGDNTLNRRSNGWHLFHIVVNDTRAEYYVDNVRHFFWDHHFPATFDTIVHGAGVSGTAAFCTFDNLSVRAFPANTVNVRFNLSDFVGDLSQVEGLVEIFDGNGNVVASTPPNTLIDSLQTMTVTAPSAGMYTVRAKAKHWLAKAVTNVDVQSIGSLAMAVTLINGDVNDDNEVGQADFTQLSAAFGSMVGDPNFNANADLNGDEEVGPADFTILSASFGMMGD